MATPDWKNTLTKAQLRESAWDSIKARAELRRADLMTQLCDLTLDRDTEQVIRGRISELNKLLALATAPAAAPRRGSVLRTASTSDEDTQE